jgi:hypothetical protein
MDIKRFYSGHTAQFLLTAIFGSCIVVDLYVGGTVWDLLFPGGMLVFFWGMHFAPESHSPWWHWRRILSGTGYYVASPQVQRIGQWGNGCGHADCMDWCDQCRCPHDALLILRDY